MTPVAPAHEKTAEYPYDLLDVEMAGLRIDHSYQRDFKQSAANKIVKNFKTELMDPLVCNLREEDGELWLIRGQHRRAALMAIYGANAVGPAIVYYGLTKEQEAEVFYTEDRNRRRLTPADRWNARIQAKEPVALDIVRICAQCGYAVDPGTNQKNPQIIRAVGALESVYRSYGRIIMQSALSAMHFLNPHISPPLGLIMGMAQFYSMYRNEPQFTTQTMNKFLTKLGFTELEYAAERRKKVDQCKINTAYCKELVIAFNKGKKDENRIPAFEVKLHEAQQNNGSRTRFGGGSDE